MPKTTPVVFISYAHEGDLQDRVKALAAWLTDKGVQVITDHPYTNRPPEKGWRAWMQHSVEDADIVLMVCSSRYKKIFEKREILDDGGLGVTWESAIITDDLYDSKMRNRRFFPILQDGGSHKDVPRVLRDWNNGHSFPSGNDGILSLIRDEVVIPTPEVAFLHKLPGELSGSNDPRLMPISGDVIGRTDELEAVRAFLNSTVSSISVCGHVTGSGGIGKTEVCKAAIKQWLVECPNKRVFYVAISDIADTQQLLVELAKAVGLSIEDQGQIQSIEQLRSHLKSGLYYLDNLEHVAESTGGLALLRSLSQLPGIRWLASSRVVLDHAFGNSITVGRLDTDSAYTLFVRLWNGDVLSCKDDVCSFVDKELGGHPLSISLLARLGKSYSWIALKELWQKQGITLAKTRKATERLDSLEISFALTRELLSKEPGALQLWQFVAIFPEGLSENTLAVWEQLSEFPDARLALMEHNVMHLESGWVNLLPPVSKYALTSVSYSKESSLDFDWSVTREVAYEYFIRAALSGSNVVSSEQATLSRVFIAEQMWAIVRLLLMDVLTKADDLSLTHELHYLLLNIYQFNRIAGREILLKTRLLLEDGNSSQSLGDIYSRLGFIDNSLYYFNEALQLYKQEENFIGIANVHRSLGGIKLKQRNYDESRIHYVESMKFYQKEESQLGVANVLHNFGELEFRLKNCNEAKVHFEKSLKIYQDENFQIGIANVLKSLGGLESSYGNSEIALNYLNDALKLYKQEQNQLGKANVYQKQGDILLSFTDYTNALNRYNQAVKIYESEKTPLGLAITLAGVIRCNHYLDRNQKLVAFQAIKAAEASSMTYVEQYVMSVLSEVFDGNEEKLQAFLATLEK